MLDGEERNHNGLTLSERLMLLEREMEEHKAQDKIDHDEIMTALNIVRAASLWGRFVMIDSTDRRRPESDTMRYSTRTRSPRATRRWASNRRA